MNQHPTPWLTQRWQKGDRYYVAEVVQDLFGLWLVKRSWGSIHTHRGNNKTVVASNYEQAVKLFQTIEKRRKARGYQHA
jgi:predicted DNA-binding WGR domain protein